MVGKPVLRDDPNTFIPPAVRKAAKLAEDIHAQVHGSTQPAPAEPTPLSPGPAPVTPEPPPTLPPDAAPPVPQPEPPAAPVDWERNYKGMEGRYKRAEQDILAMSGQIASMQNLIASMQQPVTRDTPPELRPESLLTPQEITEYGEEFLGVVGKRAKQEFSHETAALKAQISRLQQQLEGNTRAQGERARLELEASMDQKLPQWRDINVMPEFHAWLALPDMYSGAIRHELLRAAYAQANTPRVLAFFKGFLDQEAAYVPQGQQPHPNADGERVPLESFAAPGRAKTAAATLAPTEKPIIHRAQIAQFYADSAAGRWRGREAEKNRLEAMIYEAQREGRIR